MGLREFNLMANKKSFDKPLRSLLGLESDVFVIFERFFDSSAPPTRFLRALSNDWCTKSHFTCSVFVRWVGKASKSESYIFQKFLKNIVLSSSEKKESDRVQRIVGHEKFMI